ncbi:MAG: formylglycine-generating enzyme family protein [bacterium]|nr:formylglycine-generating enzyme family protein [bacterium]
MRANAPHHLFLALITTLAASGCGGQDEGELLEIERLAFVPKGRTRLGAGIECTSEFDLLVDRFEVTRADWNRWADDLELPDTFRGDWKPYTDTWPATGMTLDEARRLAELRGMRLPTVMEWMWVAAGSRGQRWPYAKVMDSAANSAELGLGRLAPVGTFYNGRTPNTEVYDLVGNAWEWVEPELPVVVSMRSVELEEPEISLSSGAWRGRWRMITPPIVVINRTDFEPVRSSILPIYPGVVDDVPTYSAWAMGGSYLVPARPLYGWRQGRRFFNAMGLDPSHRASDLGLRCVMEARDYLREHAGEWSRERYRERLIAVGRSTSWRRYSVAVLEELCAESGAPAALDWLLEGARQ